MHSQFDVTPYSSEPLPVAAEPAARTEVADLLRQLIEVQKEQVNLLKSSMAAHDNGSRWRAFLARWREDFPDLSESCKSAMQILEKSYGALMADLVERLRQEGGDALESDFALQEFLDRYGMRLAQLGTILNLVGPLAEASSQGESS
jgi:hypothetical protein